MGFRGWVLVAGLGVFALAAEECTQQACAPRAEEEEDLAAVQLRSRPNRKQGQKQPHIVFVLADDYGWANFGPHRKNSSDPKERQGWAETNTPTLDSLIEEGILLDRHYAYKICAPSRASLQSGRLAVHVNMYNTGVAFWNPGDNVSGFTGIPPKMTGIAELLREAGYKTHAAGKWDAGMATPEHTPLGKGYESFLGYYQHANDYWTQGMPLQSTGEVDNCVNRFVDFSLYNTSYKGGVTTEVRADLGCEAPNVHLQVPNLFSQVNATGCGNFLKTDWALECVPDSCNEEEMLSKKVRQIIMEHDTKTPLFLFYSLHLLHTPLQMPQKYLDLLDQKVAEKGGRPIETQNRRYYAAMTLYMDDLVSRMIGWLKDKNMYKNTLIAFVADNGGPVYEPGSGNNYPLKGGKYSDWEGGVRTNAFVSGGFVPAENRGGKFEGVISIADWYATFAVLAGINDYTDHRAEAAGLPKVDGVDQWPHILNGTNGRAGPLHLSPQAIMVYPWKLVTGKQEYSFYQGPLYPNCSTANTHMTDGPLFADWGLFGQSIELSTNVSEQDRLTFTRDCDQGCLYNVEEDPTETTDLASVNASLLASLQKTLANFNNSLFEPNRGWPTLEACLTAASIGGFYGPFLDLEASGGFYTGFNLTEEQKGVSVQVDAEVATLNRTLSSIPTASVEAFASSFGLLSFQQVAMPNASFDSCYADSL